MVTALGLFLVFYEITHSNRISGIAIVLYAMGPHYEFFDSYFIYQNVAVPFLILTLLAVLKLIYSPPGTKSHMWGAAAFTFAVLTTVSHHVTSYALLGLLGCFALSCVVMRSAGRRDWRPLVITLLTVGVIVIWDFAIAKGMVGYLKPVIDAFVSTNAIPSPAGLTRIGSSAQAEQIYYALPFLDHYGSYFSTLVLAFLVPYGDWRIWKMAASREVGAPFVAIALGSLSFYLLLVVRLFAADGSELSGRIYTYALIPVGLVAAIALDSIVRSFYMRITRLSPLRTYLYGITIGITTTTILMVGGIAAGEPSYYARLPGPYIVDAGERSVDDYNNQAALWMAKHLPHGLESLPTQQQRSL